MATSSKDLVTIDGTMTHKDALAFFTNPDGFVFKWSEDPEEISRRIDAETIAATDADALFGESEEVLKAKDWLDKPLQFLSVDWRPSDVEGEGLPFYGLFRVATPDGTIHLLSCGAKNVVLKAAKAADLGAFPRWLKLVEVPVKNPVKGRSLPIDLVNAPDPTATVGGQEPF